MKSIIVKSPAKLNLYLKVLGRRPDGYHQIVTLFERISLCDQIRLTSKRNGISIKCDMPNLPTDRSNLAFKAASLLKKHTGIKKGVEIAIKKRIPVSAGLGGGSSNAASVLSGLNRLWKLGLSGKDLMELGNSIGADVGFFLSRSQMAIGEGIGSCIKPLKAPNPLWHIVISPPKGLSTKRVYNGLKLKKAKSKLGLTLADNSAKLLIHAIINNRYRLINKYLYNELEAVALQQYNKIKEIKDILGQCGLKGLMSGSGSTVFGITSNREEAMQVGRRLKLSLSGCQVFVAKTC